MKTILTISLKKVCLGKMGYFEPEMKRPYNSASVLRFFFEILHNIRGPGAHENYINVFFVANGLL